MSKELFELSVETIEPILSLPQSGKDELNLAEFPIALLSEKLPEGVRTLQYQDQIFDAGKKRLVKRKLIIEGSELYGLPTAKDDEVILALVQLSKRQGFQSRNLEFSRFELLSMLGWANTGSKLRSYPAFPPSLGQHHPSL